MKTDTIRRGRATEAIFRTATVAREVQHESMARGPDTVFSITPQTAHEAFKIYRQARMTARSDGWFVFVVGTHQGWTRYELR